MVLLCRKFSNLRGNPHDSSASAARYGNLQRKSIKPATRTSRQGGIDRRRNHEATHEGGLRNPGAEVLPLGKWPQQNRLGRDTSVSEGTQNQNRGRITAQKIVIRFCNYSLDANLQERIMQLSHSGSCITPFPGQPRSIATQSSRLRPGSFFGGAL